MPTKILVMTLILKLRSVLIPTPETKQRVFLFFMSEMNAFHPALQKISHRRNSTMPQNTSLIIIIIHLKIILSRDF